MLSRQVCKQLLSIIDSSKELQCHIECAVAGLVPNLCWNMTSTERLNSLEKIQVNRKQATTRAELLPLPSTESAELGSRFGNLFLRAYGSKQSDVHDSISCSSLIIVPGADGGTPRARIEKLWEHTFEHFCGHSFTANPISGILAFYNSSSFR